MKDVPVSCISIPEVARRLGVSTVTAYRLAASYGFPTIRIGRRLLVSEKSFAQWLDEQSAKQAV